MHLHQFPAPRRSSALTARCAPRRLSPPASNRSRMRLRMRGRSGAPLARCATASRPSTLRLADRSHPSSARRRHAASAASCPLPCSCLRLRSCSRSSAHGLIGSRLPRACRACFTASSFASCLVHDALHMTCTCLVPFVLPSCASHSLGNGPLRFCAPVKGRARGERGGGAPQLGKVCPHRPVLGGDLALTMERRSKPSTWY